jgi:hypothetical protein
MVTVLGTAGPLPREIGQPRHLPRHPAFTQLDSNDRAGCRRRLTERSGGHGFAFGDFENVNRAALVHAKQRASQNDHDDIAKAADELLQRLDDTAPQRHPRSRPRRP